MSSEETALPAGRFTGRDLSRFATPKAIVVTALAIAAISGLASWLFAHNPDLSLIHI